MEAERCSLFLYCSVDTDKSSTCFVKGGTVEYDIPLMQNPEAIQTHIISDRSSRELNQRLKFSSGTKPQNAQAPTAPAESATPVPLRAKYLPAPTLRIRLH